MGTYSLEVPGLQQVVPEKGRVLVLSVIFLAVPIVLFSLYQSLFFTNLEWVFLAGVTILAS